MVKQALGLQEEVDAVQMRLAGAKVRLTLSSLSILLK